MHQYVTSKEKRTLFFGFPHDLMLHYSSRECKKPEPIRVMTRERKKNKKWHHHATVTFTNLVNNALCMNFTDITVHGMTQWQETWQERDPHNALRERKQENIYKDEKENENPICFSISKHTSNTLLTIPSPIQHHVQLAQLLDH
jgi:hypothetical protein